MKEQMLKQVEEKAYKYEQDYHDCSQCILLSIQEVFGLEVGDSLKAATGFAGGIGRNGSVCGALVGGVMALGLFFGRDLPTMKHPDSELRNKMRENIELKLGCIIDQLFQKFNAEYGSILCSEIEFKIFGRYFDKKKPEDRKEKNRMGGHVDKCPMVVGKAARWVTELILEEQGK
jgi:C_GCAxxG_C_C family probable redox protein